jgi:hypothetical protein
MGTATLNTYANSGFDAVTAIRHANRRKLTGAKNTPALIHINSESVETV